MTPQQILILDLNSSSCSAGVCSQLEGLMQAATDHAKLSVHTTGFLSNMLGFEPALTVLRFSPPGFSQTVIHSIRNKWRHVPVLGVVCGADRSEAVQPLLNAFDDFLSCPFKQLEVVTRVRRLLKCSNGASERSTARAIRDQFHLESLVGDSDPFLEVIQKIPRLAQSDATVLISGETGTGKELFARALHYISPRHGKPFVPVNCGALPDHLFENELFGHTKGAFTDASTTEEGLLALAEGGTLFLDEVDTLSPAAQVKLLRLLQDHEYRPLGSPKTLTADVRIVAATNADLEHLLTAKLLREDLYHRLYTLFLSIPPLRDRIDDVPALASHFLRKYESKESQHTQRLSSGALQKLMCYSWPGNVRELESVIQRTVILNPASLLQAADIDLPKTFHNPYDDSSLRAAKTRAIEQFEFAYLTKILSLHHGNVSRAAKAAGKERRAFQRLLQKHRLDKNRFLE